MAEIEKKPVKIVETILRDAHQSLIATRMTTEQMMPIVEKMDKVGYHAVECWGGATFDASLRFLKEDPWDRLRKFRDGFKNTKLQMLFRGQNILGYRPYADDVVRYFVQKSVANGIDIIRIFDCLNDLRNLQTAVDAAAEAIVQEFSAYLGRALAVFACVVDPEVIVVGGGVSKAGQILIDGVAKYYREAAFIACKDTPIVLASLGNDAGIYGAAKMLID